MRPNKYLIAAVVAVISVMTANAGAPPTVMFLPDKAWCNANGYVTRSEHNGKTRITENYDEAFLNTDLKNVLVQLNAMMKDNNLPVKEYGATTEIDDEEEMEEEAYNDDTQSGGDMATTTYEELLSKLRPDIIVKVGWDVHKVGFDFTIDYRLEDLDSYSGKSIAQVTGATAPMKVGKASYAQVIKNSATELMDGFCSRLEDHFADIQENGREITVACRIGDNGSGVNFNSEFDGKELSTIISDWMNDNSVNHAYSTRSSTRNRINFEQVRIPFKDSRGRVMQAKEFVDGLKRYLKSNYNLKSENTTKGLGTGRLYDICE